MNLKKFLALISAFSFLSLPFSAYAEDNIYNGFEYEIKENVAVITGYNTDTPDKIISLEITDSIEYNGVEYDVAGVDELAFADLKNLTSVYIPDTLNHEYMSNIAFATETSIADYIYNSMADDYDEKAFLSLVAETMEYNGKTEGWTDDELAEVKAKLNEQAALAGVTDGMDAGEAMVLMIKNRDKMNLSETTRAYFELWIATIPCSNITAHVNPNTSSSEVLDMISAVSGLNVVYTYLTGDANHDGVINVRDCAFIANSLANGNPKELPDSSDYNSDGLINVRDAAALAAFLASNM